ncbi:MAG: S8 family peptidase [Candidatus Nitrosocosmicus sp.]
MKSEKEYPHIIISNQLPDDKRKGKPPSFNIKYENKEKLFKKISNDIKILRENFESIPSDIYTPNYIFQISFNQPVSDKSVKKNLQKAKIQLISASPKYNGPWIVSTDDNLKSLEMELEKYRKTERKSKELTYEFVETFAEAKDIPPELKVGKRLNKKPLTEDFENIDIEILPMENYKIRRFLEELSRFLEERGGKILEDHTITTREYCSTRIRINKSIFDQLLQRREIKRIDRTPRYILEGSEKFKYAGEVKDIRPPQNSPEILIIDSGVNDHPIVKNSIKLDINYVTDIQQDRNQDCAHGLAVSSIALYNDLDDKVDDNSFDPAIWIHSAKILTKDNEGGYVTDKSVVLLLDKIVENVLRENPKCRVINYSIGDPEEKQNEYSTQSILVSKIDRISRENDVVFVISGGNNFEDVTSTEEYPDYLLEDTERVKILDPAYSALAITVGSIQKDNLNPENNDLPSYFTRIGPGFRGMIKPELVDYGGRFATDGIIVANSEWKSNLYCERKGTSFSTPRVAHQLAVLSGKFPHYTMNTIKALLLSSAEIPQNKPKLIQEQSIEKIMNIYGYGRADLQKALFSTDKRVILIYEGKIGINKILCFPILIPKEFNQKGNKQISVTLVYDPPVDVNNSNYLLIGLDFFLIKDTFDNITKKYGSAYNPEANNKKKKSMHKTIQLFPINSLRKKGVHQKGIKRYTRKTKIPEDNFYLVVRSTDKGIEDLKHEQSFSIVIRIEHEDEINLYNKLNNNYIRLRDKNKIKLDISTA